MLLKLFLTFLKINFLTPSGPASIGLTKELVVPNIVSEEEFVKIITMSTGIPGSDAVQISWMVGHAAKGWVGALVSMIGALTPCVLLATLMLIGTQYVPVTFLKKFLLGSSLVLFVYLVTTAFSILPKGMNLVYAFVIVLASILSFFKVGITFSLIIGGIMGVLLL